VRDFLSIYHYKNSCVPITKKRQWIRNNRTDLLQINAKKTMYLGCNPLIEIQAKYITQG